MFFLQGTPGTGKTHLLSLLRDVSEKDAIYVRISATTGIEAAIEDDGYNINSILGIGIDDNKDVSVRKVILTPSKYFPRSQRARQLYTFILLAVNEASMMGNALFEIIG